eukprot:2333953-Prymnesium_polylepis.4
MARQNHVERPRLEVQLCLQQPGCRRWCPLVCNLLHILRGAIILGRARRRFLTHTITLAVCLQMSNECGCRCRHAAIDSNTAHGEKVAYIGLCVDERVDACACCEVFSFGLELATLLCQARLLAHNEASHAFGGKILGCLASCIAKRRVEGA